MNIKIKVYNGINPFTKRIKYRTVDCNVRDKDCNKRECFRERDYHKPESKKDRRTNYQCSYRNEHGCPDKFTNSSLK